MSTVAPLGPRLTTAVAATSSSPSTARVPRKRLRLGGRREQQVRADVRDQRASGPSAAGEERSDRGEIDADRGSGAACQLDGPPTGQSERLAEQRIDRQVDGVGVREPGRAQVVGCQQVRGTTVRDEAPLAAGRHEDPDPAGPGTGHARDMGCDAIAADRVDEGPSDGVSTDRGDQRRSCPEPAEPAGRGRGGPTLHERDTARNVRPGVEWERRSKDDIEHQVAQDDDRGTRRRAGSRRS